MKNLRFSRKKILVTAVCTFYILILVLRWPGIGGEDVANARKNYNSNERGDFWGGISSIIYGNIPNYLVNWETWLLIFQLTSTATGFIIILLTEKKPTTRATAFSILILNYLFLCFAAQNTRDGLMTSFVILGCAILNLKREKDIGSSKLGFLLLLIGVSFRPWLGPVMFLIFLMFSPGYRKKIKLFLVLIAFLALPSFLNLSITSLGDFDRQYPEQQVFLMDAAGIFCSTTSSDTAKIAAAAISEYYLTHEMPLNLCNLYRVDSWVSLAKETDLIGSVNDSEFALIQSNEQIKYNKVRNLWIELIMSDPISYLQNKFNQFWNFSISSDSRVFSIADSRLIGLKQILSFVTIPFEFFRAIHLISILPTSILFNCAMIFIHRKNSVASLVQNPTFRLGNCALFGWLLISTFAYIGNNGRYGYLICGIVLLRLCIFKIRDESKNE
jgi:hypothetical protein